MFKKTLLFLLVFCNIAFAENFIIPEQKIVGAELPIPLGELVDLSISPVQSAPKFLVSTTYAWKVFDGYTEKRIRNYENGVFFGSGIQAKKLKVIVSITHLYVVKDNEKFSTEWITECKRILKDDGTIWISGTLHNHPIIGVVLKKLGMWIINDIIWYKPNATPLLQTTRVAPSIELIWLAAKSKKYYFDYNLAKEINGGKQMRNMWQINAQRHKTKHPTEKPEVLLERIISIGSKEDDIVLDPFMGSGTTGVISKKLGRKFIGIEMDKTYFDEAKIRIKNTKTMSKIEKFLSA